MKAASWNRIRAWIAVLVVIASAMPPLPAQETATGRIAGIVRNATGDPVADVTVWFCGWEGGDTQSYFFENGVPVEGSERIPKVVAGADGAFSFEQPQRPFILAASRDGFVVFLASQAITGEADLRFEPARLEGRWAPGGVPKSLARLFARRWEAALKPEKNMIAVMAAANWETTTDALGKFSFARLQDSTMLLDKAPQSNAAGTTGVIGRIRLKPGQHARVDLGGKGRPVIGRLDLDGEVLKRIAWKQSTVRVSSKLKRTGEESEDAFHGRSLRHTYQPTGSVTDGGMVRIEDVAEGPWGISIDLAGFTSRVGRADATIEMPVIPGGRSDEPLDIGLIPVELNLGVGENAPPLKAVTLDGQPFNLEDHRGKYVLIDFWATWCGPCIGEIPTLQKVWEEFGGHEKFAMVSVSIDQKIETVQEYAAKHPEAWTQVWLGSSRTPGNREVIQSWSANAIPAIYLVGPDGKIAGAGLRGGMMVSAVRAKMRGE